MTEEPLIQDRTPLEPEYHPPEPVDREGEKSELQGLLSQLDEAGGVNVHVAGDRGSGKTLLVSNVVTDLSDSIQVSYIDCQRFDTEYKALRQICRSVAEKEINTGHHTSELQRLLENRTSQLDTVVILDDVDFLLLNDGNDLLYYLSRIKHSNRIAVVTISANNPDLSSEVDERTYSSLQPQTVPFQAYDSDMVEEILTERAEDSLKPRSVHRDAIHYLADNTNDIALGLTWLKTAAENADTVITESLVRELQDRVFQKFADYRLRNFSDHRLLFQAIQELSQERDEIYAGAVYDRYQALCRTYSEEALSNRRISDYLKHLEHLNLIEADYHYGGSKGKTREVNLRQI